MITGAAAGRADPVPVPLSFAIRKISRTSSAKPPPRKRGGMPPERALPALLLRRDAETGAASAFLLPGAGSAVREGLPAGFPLLKTPDHWERAGVIAALRAGAGALSGCGAGRRVDWGRTGARDSERGAEGCLPRGTAGMFPSAEGSSFRVLP